MSEITSVTLRDAFTLQEWVFPLPSIVAIESIKGEDGSIIVSSQGRIQVEEGIEEVKARLRAAGGYVS